jgi:hypothetical protein
MSPDDDRRSEQGSSGEGSSGEEAFTEELKRIDAESEAVEVDFEAEAVSESDDGALDVRDADDDEEFEALIWALPGLTRLALKSWLRALGWSARTSMRVSLRLGRAAVDPRASVVLARDVSSGVRVYAREFLGISDLERRVEEADPGAATRPPPSSRALARRDDDSPPPPEVSLRVRGAQLLRQSADVRADDQTHPAYARIIAELAPDEGRILRLLATDGPQPVVDVRALNLIGVGSQLVASELSMVGPESGVRHVARVPEYMINLQRLGLIEFSDKAISDPIRYQVVEAQPHVLESIKEATRAKTVHRSLRLTPFGERFCDVVLPLDLDEVEDLTDAE